MGFALTIEGELIPYQHPPQPTATPDEIKRSIHRVEVILSQDRLVQDLISDAMELPLGAWNDFVTLNRKGDQFAEAQRAKTIMDGHHSLQCPLLPFYDLRPEDRLEVSDLSSTPNQVLWGKYFLCQTISPATKMRAIEVTVTDPKGTKVIRLSLYNYSFNAAEEKSVLEVNFDEILPPGSFLVVKNPWFVSTPGGPLILRCDNPAEVELISEKRLGAKFPDLVWNGSYCMEVVTFQLFQKRHFWNEFKEDISTFLKLKRLGNKGFVDKRFTDAIRFYDMALDYCADNQEDEAMIQSNKSAALLSLGCFNAALKCADLALEIYPANEKYNYRKTKALIGLGKYEEGLSFLGAKFEQFSSLGKSKDCKALLETVKFMSSRQNLGPTESQLLSLQIKTAKADDNIPEYIGPLAVTEIEGKGRGFIATEDIHTGQIIICTKAFSYNGRPLCSNFATDERRFKYGFKYGTTSHEQIIRKVANKLAFDPELGPKFYNLTAGAELGYLEPDDPKITQVDMNRIMKIVKIGAFADEDRTMGHSGLWIAPSLFNHSCSEHNCIWAICGEWMTVRAISEIKKGEEILMVYIDPIQSYECRLSVFKSRGFVCNCKICQLEAKEPASVVYEREEILQSLGELTLDCGPAEIQTALNNVKKLILLRKDNVPCNFPMLSPQLFKLTDILSEKDRLGDAISVMDRMYEVAKSSVCWAEIGIPVAIFMVTCHAKRWDKENAKLWVGTLKGLLMKFYGNLERMKDVKDLQYLRAPLPFEILKKRFGIDFFQDD